jgi:hypothetical protein
MRDLGAVLDQEEPLPHPVEDQVQWTSDHLGSFRFAGFQFVFLRSRSLLVSTSRMINVGATLIATVVGANRCVACSAKAAKTNVPTSVATDIPIRARNNLAMSANAGTAI